MLLLLYNVHFMQRFTAADELFVNLCDNKAVSEVARVTTDGESDPGETSGVLLGLGSCPITPQSWNFVFLFEFVFGFVFVFVPVLVFVSVCEGESDLGETGKVLQPHYSAIVGLRLSTLKLQDTDSQSKG